MKYVILATAAAVTLSTFAMASESRVGQDSLSASVSVPASAAQEAAVTAIKVAMGPTSAAQKPGGSGEEPKQTPKVHKKVKHKQKPA